MSAIEQLKSVSKQLQQLYEDCQLYASQHSHVTGTTNLSQRIKRDLHRANYALSDQGYSTAITVLQGVRNNARGLRAELMAAQQAPGVVAVCQRMYNVSAAELAQRNSTAATKGTTTGKGTTTHTPGNAHSTTQSNDLSSNDMSSSIGGIETVEVDVVACGGACWVEVKEYSGSMGEGSASMEGPQGLGSQIKRLLRIANAPCNHFLWRPPRVAVWFPSQSVPAAVQEHLVSLGVIVCTGSTGLDTLGQMYKGQHGYSNNHHRLPGVGGDLPSSCSLPIAGHPGMALPRAGARVTGAQKPVPTGLPSADVSVDLLLTVDPLLTPWAGLVHAPNTVNIDVTTLCALVSESSHASVEDPLLVAWARRNRHWQASLEQEIAGPRLLEQLGPYLHKHETCPLYASHAAVNHFETLLGTIGGPLELHRWQQLRSKIHIVPSVDDTPHPVVDAPQPRSTRVATVPGLTPLQQQVFSLSNTLRAITLTANSKAVTALRMHGVQLPVHVHAARWLTGL